MSRGEFLKVLGESLSQELSRSQVNGHIEYYEQYIDGEVRKGNTEEQVIGSLGDPRLIAKTILEMSDTAGAGNNNNSSGSRSSYGRGDYGTEDGEWSSEGRHHVKKTSSPAAHLVIGILIAVAVIGMVFTILRVLIPIVLPIVAVVAVISYFRKRQQ